jgi:hypothetical protein
LCGSSARGALRDPRPEHAITLAEHVRRQGHLPHDPALSGLESLNARNTALDVDRGRREREHFRDARAGPSERQAEQAYLRWRAPCSLGKAPPLGGVEIFPATGWTEAA